jgi:hypothetical protein
MSENDSLTYHGLISTTSTSAAAHHIHRCGDALSQAAAAGKGLRCDLTARGPCARL